MSTEDEKLLKEAKKLPWDERLLHKNWKVRNDANIDLAFVCDSIMDPKDPRLKDFAPLFRKTVADSNAPVQEKALDALIAFLRAADAGMPKRSVIQLRLSGSLGGQKQWRRPRQHFCFGLNYRQLRCSWKNSKFPS